MKKTIKRATPAIAAAMTSVMLFSASAPIGAKFFTDVSLIDWALDAINYAADNGYINGSGKVFSPNSNMIRVDVAVALYKFAGSPYTVPRKIYTDYPSYVSIGGKALTWAYDNGIMGGTSATTFDPSKGITREDLAVVLYRYASYKGYDMTKGNGVSLTGYTDYSSIFSYAVNAIKWAIGSKIMGGTSESTLDPKATVTRRVAAEFLRKFGIYSAKIRWGTDNYSFTNHFQYFQKEHYYITPLHKEYLLDDLRRNGELNRNPRYPSGSFNMEKTLEVYLDESINNESWGGSCYGMVITMALCKWGKLDMVGNFGASSDSTLYDLSASNDVISAINYYQFTQYIPTVSNWVYKINAAGSNLKAAFNKIPDAIDSLGLVPFGYRYLGSDNVTHGHEILLYRYEKQGNKITVYYYDPNVDYNTSPESSFYFYTSDSSFEINGHDIKRINMPEYEGKNIYDMFLCYDDYDLDTYTNTSGGASYVSNESSIQNHIEAGDSTYLIVRLRDSFEIENAEGEKLIYSNGEFSGDMEIISEVPIITGGDDAIETRIEVRSSDSFRLTTESEESELTVLNSKIFSSGKGNGVHEIIINSAGEVSLIGDDVKYRITTFVSGGDADRITVSGNAESHMSVESALNGWSVDGVKGDCVITTYDNGVAETKTVSEELLNKAASIQTVLAN